MLLLAAGLGCGARSSRSGGEPASAGAGGTSGAAASAGAPGVPTEVELACTKNSDCVFAMTSCCRCNAFSLEQVVAVNGLYADEYRARSCDGSEACTACDPSVDHALLSTCQAGRCVAVDLTQTDVTFCRTADDCKFRSDRCCGCTAQSNGLPLAIARDKDGAYEALRCDPGEACAECAVAIPEAPDFNQGCFDDHCVILGLPR